MAASIPPWGRAADPATHRRIDRPERLARQWRHASSDSQDLLDIMMKAPGPGTHPSRRPPAGRGDAAGNRRRAGRALRAGFTALALASMLAPPALARSKNDDWPEIPAAEKAIKEVPQDPDADAVILLNTREGQIILKGKYYINALTYHWRLKVLKKEGSRYAEVRIPGDKYSVVSHIRARTVRPDGTVVEVPPESIFEKEVRRTRRSRSIENVFTFPAAEPGAILEYAYDRESRYLYFMPTWFFSGPEPTLHSRVSQAVPYDASYVTLCDQCPDPEPDITPWKRGKDLGRLFTFDRHDIPAVRDEPWMPPEREVGSRLEMVLKRWEGVYWKELQRNDYLFSDWKSVAMFADSTYDKMIKLGQHDLKPLVAGWTEGIDPQDTRAVARAIYRHVQADVRYVDSDLVIGTSRMVEEMLATHSADNEEKAVLLDAALQAAGIDAHMAMVCAHERGGLYMNFPSLAPFTHDVVAATLKDGTVIWLDPTETHAPFGFLPSRISGAAALMIDATPKLMVLPREAQPGRTRYTEDLSPGAQGGTGIEVEATFWGEDAMDMRDDLVPVGGEERTAVLQQWLRNRRAGASLLRYSLEHLDDLDAPLVLKMTINVPGAVSTSEGAILVRGCVLSCYDANPIPGAQRRYPIYIDQGWNTEEILTVHVPPGDTVAPLPPPVHQNATVASLEWSCSTPSADTARCTQHVTGASMHLQSGDAGALRSFFDDVVQSDRNQVALLTPDEAAAH
jgi:Domain of Unknown Function with PDB structure (DUF3857)